MQNLISPHKSQKNLDLLIIISVLTLAILIISPQTASGSNPDQLSSSDMGTFSEQIHTEATAETQDSEATAPYESSTPFSKIGQSVNIIYTAGGIGAAVLILFGYLHVTPENHEFAKKTKKSLHLSKRWKTAGSKEDDKEKTKIKKLRIFTAAPVLAITFAELLIFSGRMGAAVWVHIGIVITLSLSNIFIKDPEIYRIYQAFMLLPVLRLINLSMPIFFETTLYTFIFIYGPLAIPVAIILLHQWDSLENIGITKKHLVPYMLISIPLGFLLGLGEYFTIRAGYLIPDLTFENLLKLTIIMVFFVGLVEELIFRSILQSRLEKTLGVWEALLITSFMFGIMHSGYGTFHEILYTGFVGFIMGFAFYKTRSLPFIAVLHGFVNVFLFGILPHQLGTLPLM